MPLIRDVSVRFLHSVLKSSSGVCRPKYRETF